jgi:peptidoglycan/xylan/chitin deacetylase (PgdA/CDA1 family)
MGKLFYALFFLATVSVSVQTNGALTAFVGVARFAGNRVAAISYTFDDGTLGHYTVAAPTLERYGFRGTFGVVAGKTADDPEAAQKLALKIERGTSIIRRVSWQEWRELAAKGHEIANHSLTHRGLPGLSDEQLDREVNESARIITQKVGCRPLTFIYPGNGRNPKVREFVLKTHIAAREHEERFGGPDFSVAKANGIIDKAIKSGQAIVIMTHAVAEAGYQPITQEQLEEHLQYVTTLKDKLWVDTFANVSKYVRERDAAKVVVKTKDANQITFYLTCPLDSELFNAPLTCVINPVEQVVSAAARQESGAGDLPVRVSGNKILVDIIPGTGAVVVQWKNISRIGGNN